MKDTSSLQFQNSFSVNMLLSVCVYSNILMVRKKEAPKEEWGCWKKQELHKEKHRNGGLGYVSGKNNIGKGLLSLCCGLRGFFVMPINSLHSLFKIWQAYSKLKWKWKRPRVMKIISRNKVGGLRLWDLLGWIHRHSQKKSVASVQELRCRPGKQSLGTDS